MFAVEEWWENHFYPAQYLEKVMESSRRESNAAIVDAKGNKRKESKLPIAPHCRMCCNCILGKYMHMYIISIFNHFKIFKKNIYHVPSFRRVSFWKLDWEWNIDWWCFRVWEVMRNYQQFYSEQKYPIKHAQAGLKLGNVGLPKRPWKNYWNVETGRLKKKKKNFSRS